MSEQPVPCKMEIDNCDNYNEHIGCNPACTSYVPIDPEMANKLENLAVSVDEVIEKKSKNDKDINLKISGLEKFNKKHEFIVLKHHIFEMQSISPKKIILKFKRKLNNTDNIKNGIYVFVDRDDELLEPHKVFNKFERDTKAAEKAREEKVNE